MESLLLDTLDSCIFGIKVFTKKKSYFEGVKRKEKRVWLRVNHLCFRYCWLINFLELFWTILKSTPRRATVSILFIFEYSGIWRALYYYAYGSCFEKKGFFHWNRSNGCCRSVLLYRSFKFFQSAAPITRCYLVTFSGVKTCTKRPPSGWIKPFLQSFSVARTKSFRWGHIMLFTICFMSICLICFLL